MKKFCASKNTVNRIKRRAMKWEEIFGNHIKRINIQDLQDRTLETYFSFQRKLEAVEKQFIPDYSQVQQAQASYLQPQVSLCGRVTTLLLRIVINIEAIQNFCCQDARSLIKGEKLFSFLQLGRRVMSSGRRTLHVTHRIISLLLVSILKGACGGFMAMYWVSFHPRVVSRPQCHLSSVQFSSVQSLSRV